MRISDWSSDVCSSDLPCETSRTGRFCDGGPHPSWVMVSVPKAAEPLAWTTRSGMRSRSKWACFSKSGQSRTRSAPRRPAVCAFRLSATGMPAVVVRVGREDLGRLDMVVLHRLKIGRAHVCTHVTNAHLVRRLQLDTQNNNTNT